MDLIAKYDCDIGAAHALMEKLSKDNEVLKAETENMEVCNLFFEFKYLMCIFYVKNCIFIAL